MAEVVLLHVGSGKIGVGLLQAGFFFSVLSAFTGSGLVLNGKGSSASTSPICECVTMTSSFVKPNQEAPLLGSRN